MSMERITIKHIASGQPRPYADSRTITHVQFETTPSMWSPYSLTSVKPEDVPWEPRYLGKYIRLHLERVGIVGRNLPMKGEQKHGLDSMSNISRCSTLRWVRM